MKLFEIKYKKDGALDSESINAEFVEKPSCEQAAIVLRNALFGVFLIPDTPRNIADKNVWQLEKAGVHIVGIVEVET